MIYLMELMILVSLIERIKKGARTYLNRRIMYARMNPVNLGKKHTYDCPPQPQDPLERQDLINVDNIDDDE